MVEEQVRTLVVDDEEPIRSFLKEIMQNEGHTVTTAASGEEALARLRETPFDLILLDLKLGGQVDGTRVLEAVKWRWPETAVIILTGYGSLESALSAIREGVDGYLLKPPGLDEMLQLVRGTLLKQRGRPAARDPLLRRGPLAVNRGKHQATLNGQPLDLTPREFKLLVYLMENSHRVVPPRELIWVVQGYECEDESEAREVIKRYVYRLRRKVEPDPSGPRYILNVRGVGYILDEKT